eukprot:gene5558-11188_t
MAVLFFTSILLQTFGLNQIGRYSNTRYIVSFPQTHIETSHAETITKLTDSESRWQETERNIKMRLFMIKNNGDSDGDNGSNPLLLESRNDNSSVNVSKTANKLDFDEGDKKINTKEKKPKQKTDKSLRFIPFFPDPVELNKLREQRRNEYPDDDDDGKEDDNNWNIRYDLLLEYKRQHGHCNVPSLLIYHCSDGNKIGLGNWLVEHREKLKRNKRLKIHRKKKLQRLVDEGSLSLSVLDDVWNQHYNALLSYGESHNGDCNVPISFVWTLPNGTDIKLGNWLRNQFYYNRRKELRKDRMEKLQAMVDKGSLFWMDGNVGYISFIPDLFNLSKLREQRRKEYPDDDDDDRLDNDWNFRYELLLEYKRQHGHCNVPQAVDCLIDGKQIKLGRWLIKQRTDIRQETIKHQREEKLQKLAADGNLSLSPYDDVWNRNFEALLSYGECHTGDCNVLALEEWTLPDGTKHALGDWLHKQRTFKVKNTLPKERMERLQVLVDKGSLSWEPLEDTWDFHYEALLSYGESHNGNYNVPQSHVWTLPDGSYINLGDWLRLQRAYRRNNKNKLPMDRLNRLQVLVDKGSLSWDPYEDSWELHYEALLSYGESHNGDCNVPISFEWTLSDGINIKLGKWLSEKRGRKNLNQLSKDKVEKLQTLVDQGKLKWRKRKKE